MVQQKDPDVRAGRQNGCARDLGGASGCPNKALGIKIEGIAKDGAYIKGVVEIFTPALYMVK